VNYLKFTPDTELRGRRSRQRAGASGQAIFMACLFFMETTGKILPVLPQKFYITLKYRYFHAKLVKNMAYFAEK
jgi:hypothetical protein